MESEFYALRSIKIPVKPNSVLTEILAQEMNEHEQSSVNSNPRETVLGVRSISSCSDIESDVDMHVGIISINQILREKKTRKEAKRFLEKMNNDLSEMREKTKTYKDSLEEATATLTDVRFHSLEQKPRFSISLCKFIILMVLILVIFPIIVYFYRKHEIQSKGFFNDHSNGNTSHS